MKRILDAAIHAAAALARLAAICVGTAGVLVVALLLSAGAIGQGAIGGGGGGGLTAAVADTLYCKLTGCTMTGGTIYSGVSTDISTPGSEDFTIAPGGAWVLNTSTAHIGNISGTAKMDLAMPNSSQPMAMTTASGVAGIGWRPSSLMQIGVTTSSPTSSSKILTVGHKIDSSGFTEDMDLYGHAVLVLIPNTALVISGSPDTTSAPMDAGTACRMSAASAGQSWTPAETNATEGAYVCCTNTGSNSISITASSGVYEGGGGAVAQWKTVCMEYVSSRWVQRGSISP